MTDQQYGGASQPDGTLVGQVTRDLGDLTVRPVDRRWHLRNWLTYRRRDLPKLTAMRLLGYVPGVLHMEASLRGGVYRAPWAALPPWQAAKLKQLLAENFPVAELPRFFGGRVTDYGVLSTRLVTTAGVNFIVDAFQNLVELELMKYHGFGTGVGAEATGDTALGTELTTEYAVNSTRPTGSQTETSANIYSTVATLSPDSGGTLAITEHGIFSATSAGTLLDRSVFSAVNLVASSDSLQATYNLTISAGG